MAEGGVGQVRRVVELGGEELAQDLVNQVIHPARVLPDRLLAGRRGVAQVIGGVANEIASGLIHLIRTGGHKVPQAGVVAALSVAPGHISECRSLVASILGVI